MFRRGGVAIAARGGVKSKCQSVGFDDTERLAAIR
jgi:hypothetical protein